MEKQAPLQDVLGKLPWFDELTAVHRRELLFAVQTHLQADTSRGEYAQLLEHWATVAHGDAKWRRLELLRQSGLLAS